MQKFDLKYAILIVSFICACSRNDQSSNYRSHFDRSKTIAENGTSTPLTASNQHGRSSGESPEGAVLQNQPDNNGFIVGNGQTEDVKDNDPNDLPVQIDPSLYLALGERAEDISEIYIVGQEDTPVSFSLVGDDSIAITGVEDSERVSFIIKTNDKFGIKTSPLNLVKNNPQTAQVELLPLQTVTGKAVNLWDEGEIKIAGTKMVASKPDGSGMYTIQDVPVGSHKVSIKGQSQQVLVASEIKDGASGSNMPEIDAQLQLASLCENQDLEEKIITFDSFESYQAISEDKAIGFKNKLPLVSKSQKIVAYSEQMIICNMEMKLHPNNGNFEYTNELVLSLNDNFLYTQIADNEEQNVMSVKNPIVEFIESIIEGIVGFFTELFKFLLQINEPLVVGFDADSQPSLVNNVFRSSQFDVGLYCTEDKDHCDNNIEQVELILRVGTVQSAESGN
ncbi:MAG: hypothetical protein HRU09_15975 [Oligoflexales bacterium]|nr:hypothetical protein [Oligoflexales bacterium]